jgi:hypothetical protein
MIRTALVKKKNRQKQLVGCLSFPLIAISEFTERLYNIFACLGELCMYLYERHRASISIIM